MTTMLLSTSIPTPSASPAREMTLSVTPEKYISTTANIRLIGMLNAMMMVGRTLRKNSSKIRMASAPPISRFSMTELTTMSI